jgi:hypothetical protein
MVFSVDALQFILRHLSHPAVLSSSELAGTALVKHRQQAEPGMALDAAVRAVLTDTLAELEAESPTLADLLQGRFWEELTVAEMVHAERPEPQSERRFYDQQHRAIERLAALLTAQERLA